MKEVYPTSLHHCSCATAAHVGKELGAGGTELSHHHNKATSVNGRNYAGGSAYASITYITQGVVYSLSDRNYAGICYNVDIAIANIFYS